MNKTPFHDGELAVQQRLGVRGAVAEYAGRYIRDHLPAQHRAFYEQLPFVAAAARDAQDRPWVTLLAGAPGFMTAPDALGLTLATRVPEQDPLATAFAQAADVGLLGIELATRRRNRANGRLQTLPDGTLQFSARQTFGNCPAHITPREWVPAPAAPTTAVASRSAELTRAQQDWIRAADTFFIGSGFSDGDGDDAANGMDASHRGGPAGFVTVTDAHTLHFPDYAGNNHFNTVGNLVRDPRVALTFVDFEQGHLLQITGTATIDWAPTPETAGADARRLIEVRIDAVVEQQAALPIRWQTPAAHPLTLRVADKTRESDRVTSFRLESADGTPLPAFRAGQHLPLALPINAGSAPLERSYSLSGAPEQDSYRISVKRESDGTGSRWLHDRLQVGDLLRAGAPAGDFELAAGDAPVVLISAGVGITPMMSMLHTLAAEQPERDVRFIHSARNGTERAFAAELEALRARLPKLRTHIQLSRPAAMDRPGADYDQEGRLSAAALAELALPLSAQCYLCGPTGLVSDLGEALIDLGIADDHIHSESFGAAGAVGDHRAVEFLAAAGVD
ncbi:MAG: pyridoxamine 5'-phosphate oxidase family protein [Pseudomonadota bacterium]